MNKKVGIIIGVFVAFVLLGGGIFVMTNRGNATITPTPMDGENQTVESLSPDAIGLKMQTTSDNKKVKVMISKASDIKSLEYEITYEADIPAAERVEGAEGETRTTRGFSDEATLSGKSTYESKEFDLGSCSRNVCRYDTGVTQLDLVMKVTKTNGKIYQVEDSLEI